MSYPDPLPESLRAFMNWRVSWPDSDIPARLADAAIADFRHVFGQAEAELAALKAAMSRIAEGSWNFGNDEPGLTVMEFARLACRPPCPRRGREQR
jgi:hypothetical protein